MSDKNMIMPLESLNKITAYLSTRPWNEAQPLLMLFSEAKEVPGEETKAEKK